MYFHSVLSESICYLPISDSQKWPLGTFNAHSLPISITLLPSLFLSSFCHPSPWVPRFLLLSHLPRTFHFFFFIPPGNRGRLQLHWEHDRVRSLRWSLGLDQKCYVSRSAATGAVPDLPLRIRTAGRTRITRVQNVPHAAAWSPRPFYRFYNHWDFG